MSHAAERGGCARACGDDGGVGGVDGKLDRRSGRLVEVAAAAGDAPARAVVALLVRDVLRRVVQNAATSAADVDVGGSGGGRAAAAGAAEGGGRVRAAGEQEGAAGSDPGECEARPGGAESGRGRSGGGEAA
eukprot:4382404-Prymnesium_polylepis.1